MSESSPQGAGVHDAPPPRLSPTGLRPCPFCDSVELGVTTVKGNMVCIIVCRACLTTAPVGLGRHDPDMTQTEAEASVRHLWNTRGGLQQ